MHVPYKGSSPAFTDLLGGQVNLLFDNIPAPMVYARNDVISAIVPYAMAGRASASDAAKLKQ